MIAISGLSVDYNSKCTENKQHEGNESKLRSKLIAATRALLRWVSEVGRIISPTLVL